MHDAHDTIALVRRYVDGEMTADERQRFEKRLEGERDLASHVAAEQALKSQVAALLGGVCCPRAVAERVGSALAEAPAETPGAPRPDHGRRDVVATPFRANVFAVAASLLLVAGAVLWGIFGRPIDSLTTAQDPIAEAATFVSGEHGRCAGSDLARNAKASITERGPLQRFLRDHLGANVPSFDLTDIGYELKGGGECMVPGHRRSGHIIFVRPGKGGGADALVSIFVVPDVGQYDLDSESRPVPGRWYEVLGEAGAGHHVLCSTDGRLMYFVTCCRDPDLEPVALRLGAALVSPGS